jgi:hypothetical protein
MGVSKKGNRWRAQIEKNGVKYRIGSFKTQEEAAEAYNAKAKELYANPKLNIVNVPEVVENGRAAVQIKRPNR